MRAVSLEYLESLDLDSMTKGEKDKLRSSVLNGGEIVYVEHDGRFGNFPKNVPIECRPRFAQKSGLPYPLPKWEACCYQIDDLDGDMYEVAKDRYGEIRKGFKWL